MHLTKKEEKSRDSRTFRSSGSDGTRTRDLRRDRTDEKPRRIAQVAQTQAQRCEQHAAKLHSWATGVRKEYVPPPGPERDQRARELAFLLRGHDCFDSLDEICQQRYRHLITRMDRMPA
jgi:hypothetical protein